MQALMPTCVSRSMLGNHLALACREENDSPSARPQTPCPNCRGPGQMIAIWHYIDPDRVTQVVGGQRAENLLEQNAAHFDIAAGDLTPQPSPRTGSASTMTTGGWVVSGAPSPQGQHRSGSSMYVGEHFHVHTQLPDGRPSILVDPGSVSNLCGDKWARK